MYSLIVKRHGALVLTAAVAMLVGAVAGGGPDPFLERAAATLETVSMPSYLTLARAA